MALHRSLLAASLLVALSAAPAWAHAHLIRAVPAADATLAQAPTALDLGFSEAVDLAFTGVTVTGPQGAVTTGQAALDADGSTLAVPLSDVLPAGRYTVAWHALARDGHKTQGEFSFTLQP